MNIMSTTLRTLALIAALSFVARPTIALAQTEQHQHGQTAVQNDQTKMKPMPMGQMKMPSMKMDELAARKKANTERIAKLMEQVKTAQGDARIAAMVEMIGILVEERAAMQEHCAEMHAMMGK